MRRIIYASYATQNITEDTLYKILLKAHDRNEMMGITGLLLYRGREFMQLLEGPAGSVSELYQRIRKDPLHSHVTTLLDEQTDERLFGDWRMGVAEVTDATLRSHPSFSVFMESGFVGSGECLKDAALNLLARFRDRTDLDQAAA